MGAMLLGILVPVPGYIIAGVIWNEGIHGVSAGWPTVFFIVLVIASSMALWALALHAILPKGKAGRDERP
jgi:hypothetical protein